MANHTISFNLNNFREDMVTFFRQATGNPPVFVDNDAFLTDAIVQRVAELETALASQVPAAIRQAEEPLPAAQRTRTIAIAKIIMNQAVNFVPV